ncbi:hypothetical protein SUGI_0134130 [Cryptomeria japonica]|uniref:disease resistance protein At4g27190 n=1 Tax=Cryptomeria japonica TaxID=3369 RepID=UPI0024089E60|nr:disease resistance protein At4g27190 [Cryptomeria japonica]GLJ10740.1 hypothetical protein SUGI_0134130 [Cryptomeria japonica]
MNILNALSGVAGEGVKKLFQEIKNLASLHSNAKSLRKEIDRLKGIGDDIKSQLRGKGRQPKLVVRNWLDRQAQIVKFAEEVLHQYEQSKSLRFCGCCPHCLLIPKSSRKILNSLAEIVKLLKMKDSDFPKSDDLGEPPGTLLQPMENKLVGKFVHEKLLEMETWLLKDESLRVVGVYGMPGVGKTSMLKHINNNEKVVNFFKLVIWVTVSRDSDISDLQRRICDRIELPWRPNLSIDEVAGLLQTVFKERQLLLILDDVWKRIDVSKLGISTSDNKIKVVLTSRDKEVCRSMKADKMIAMKQLSEEDGWELFCRGALPAGEDQNMDSEIEPFARSIAKECKGHPLAIKTLARTVPQLQSSTPSEWEYVLKQLKEINTQFYRIHENILRDLFKPLKHSYDALESDELRLCFLYLAAYREDEEIDADELIQLWLAEGLVNSREEGRHDFLRTLVNRCLVEIEVREANGHQICKVKIHDVLRDMAVHVAEVDQNILFRAGQSLTEFPKSASATSVRISLMHNRIRILPESVNCEKLVTLLLSWNTFEEVPESFLEKLNMLKVLDLSNTPIKFLPSSIHQLKHLLYLQLSNTQIKVIPHQTFELSRLQFLDLSFSPLKNIPSMIKKLKSLQTLNLAHCYDLEFVSSDISQLTSLEELDLWKSTMFGNSRDVRVGGESREASLQDVCKLHRLKHLRLILKSQIEEKTVGNLVKLQELWLLWMPEVRQTYLPTDMVAMHSLERLHLYNCHVKGTPDLFPELQNLKYLKLKSSQILLTLSGLGLATLSNLNEIDIEECLLLTELGEEFGRKGCFPRLRKLKLSMLPSLESVCSFVEEGALPMLQTLTIFRCMKFKVLPPGLDNLNSLEQIKGEKEWWNEISWRNEEMKKHVHAKYVEIVEIHDNYHV